MNESDKMYEQAETLLQEGKVDQCITILSNIITDEPDNLLAYSALAVAYAEKKQFDQAEKILHQSFELSKTLDIDKFIDVLKGMIAKFPNFSLTYYLLGKVYTHKGEYTQAEYMLHKALTLSQNSDLDDPTRLIQDKIDLAPDYPFAFYELGHNYTEIGQYEQAEQVLQQAIELKEDWYLPQLQLGWVYEKQQKLEQALSYYRNAVSLKPDDFYAHTYLGYMLQQLGDQRAGVKELEIAYQLNAQDTTLIHNLANGRHKLDQTNEAMKLLDHALETLASSTPNLAHLYHLRGSIYLDLGELDQALADIQKAIILDPTTGRFYDDLGDVYFEREDYTEAINSYTQAAGYNDQKGSAFKGIGRTYLRLEEWANALAFFEKAREAGEIDYFGFGIAYFELNDDERGIDNLSKELLNKGPAQTEASYYLGFAYAAVGERRLAIEAFKHFLELSTDKADEPEWKDWRAEVKNQIEELSVG